MDGGRAGSVNGEKHYLSENNVVRRVWETLYTFLEAALRQGKYNLYTLRNCDLWLVLIEAGLRKYEKACQRPGPRQQALDRLTAFATNSASASSRKRPG